MPAIFPIPAFKDNYIWCFHQQDQAWVVDPGQSESVIKTLETKKLKLTGILITHHHYDHTDGVKDLLKAYPQLKVIGSHKSPHDFIHQRVKESDTVSCGLKVLEIPGHTLDHIAYYNDEWLFSGDTLFSIGCGKVFEGTPAQMFNSLQKLIQLPNHLQLYCGHEYTLANLKFAATVEPMNKNILEKIKVIEKLRSENYPSLPSLLKDEKNLNPFLRCEEESIKAAVEKYFNKKLKDPIEVFAYLREWKNHF